MKSEIKTFTYPNGDKQRVQLVRLDSWSCLRFLRPESSTEAFVKLCELFENFFVAKLPMLFGRMILFYVPDDMEPPFPREDENIGTVYDPTVAVTAAFRRHIRCKKGELVFTDEQVKAYYKALEDRGALKLLSGKRNTLALLPVGKGLGFLSRSAKTASLKVNASFFTMDCIDLGSIYDMVGTPIGLCVKDGVIENPPAYNREVLMVKNGKVSVTQVRLEDICVELDGTSYAHGKNAVFFARPNAKKTPKGGFDIIIVGNRVVASKSGGESEIPSGGFTLHLDRAVSITNTAVRYHGLEGVDFAIQVGNSVSVGGRKTERFISPFYHFLRPWEVSYPPSMYPLNYKKDRAPRIVLGADQDNRPMLLWFEGAGKFGYTPGRDSAGASLSEAADICEQLGVHNGIHLDGGGSAQILLKNKRQLLISDRDPINYSEQERAIAMGLRIE